MTTLNDARQAMIHIECVTADTTAIMVAQVARQVQVLSDFLNEQVAESVPVLKNENAPQPVDMILFCPQCGVQHVDAPESRQCGWPDCGCDGVETLPCEAAHRTWTNPPHRSHLCHGCGHIWRPADVPTNGVREIETKGEHDSRVPIVPTPCANCALMENQLTNARQTMQQLADGLKRG